MGLRDTGGVGGESSTTERQWWWATFLADHTR